MKLAFEIDTAGPPAEVVRQALAASAALVAVARMLDPHIGTGMSLGTSAAAPALTQEVPETTQPRRTRTARGNVDPVDAYNKLAAVAGAQPVSTDAPAETAQAEPSAPTETAQANPPTTPEPADPASADTARPSIDEMRSRIKSEAVQRGVLWVRSHIMEAYKVARMAELTDEQIVAIYDLLSEESAA